MNCVSVHVLWDPEFKLQIANQRIQHVHCSPAQRRTLGDSCSHFFQRRLDRWLARSFAAAPSMDAWTALVSTLCNLAGAFLGKFMIADVKLLL